MKAEEKNPEAPSPEIEAAAKQFLMNLSLFDVILSDLETLGLWEKKQSSGWDIWLALPAN